ncbi:uncharacterized protein G2W53_002531 [Senna tora]|uniref:Uncharacterized protein n=1 Tax=Senna tora TaxID=362788 RepID=A0A835CLA0_9FABA|nr:uncharacterized protein G2W53_002531 [Senna tora]
MTSFSSSTCVTVHIRHRLLLTSATATDYESQNLRLSTTQSLFSDLSSRFEHLRVHRRLALCRRILHSVGIHM